MARADGPGPLVLFCVALCAAVLFAEACLEHGLILVPKEDADESSHILDSVWSRAADWAGRQLGHRQLARYYQTKARLGSKAAAS